MLLDPSAARRYPWSIRPPSTFPPPRPGSGSNRNRNRNRPDARLIEDEYPRPRWRLAADPRSTAALATHPVMAAPRESAGEAILAPRGLLRRASRTGLLLACPASAGAASSSRGRAHGHTGRV